jgi:hypothetical protein
MTPGQMEQTCIQIANEVLITTLASRSPTRCSSPHPQMEQTCIQIANEVLITTFARSHMATSLRFVRGDPNVIDVVTSKTGAFF